LAATFTIGSTTTGTMQADQYLDGLRVWPRKLTAAEMLKDFAYGR